MNVISEWTLDCGAIHTYYSLPMQLEAPAHSKYTVFIDDDSHYIYSVTDESHGLEIFDYLGNSEGKIFIWSDNISADVETEAGWLREVLCSH